MKTGEPEAASPSKENKHYYRGMAMAFSTAFLWGFLPIFLKVALKYFSSQTIVGFRFLFAFVVLGAILIFRSEQPSKILMRPPLIGILTGILLAGNYFYFLEGVNFSGPANSGVLIQIAPAMVAIAGVFLFKERFSKQQAIGLFMAGVGLYLFYVDRVSQVTDMEIYSQANLYIFIGAVLWAGYMICQKVLCQDYKAQHLNLLTYGIASIMFVPWIIWPELSGLSLKAWGLLIFLGVNTILAYGALAEAVKYIPVSLISVIITVNPLITLFATQFIDDIFPGMIPPESVGVSGWFGACAAITGIILVIRKKG
ncbi:MAG: DMT family transporter [Nitrospinales bacterium]